MRAMAFRITGLPGELAAEVRRTLVSPQYGHPAHRAIASGYGPCRHCLRIFRVGVDERILFTYQPFSAPGTVPAPGPIFVHAATCERYDASELPADFHALPLFLEAYGPAGRLLVQERVQGHRQEALERIFSTTGADYVHIRNAEVGCFMARADRA